MSESATRTILDALCRAATEPHGAPLLAVKNESGLFPSGGKAKTLAERCKTDGYLEVVRTETSGKISREICILTDKGRAFLLDRTSPRQLLEDLLRVVERREKSLNEIVKSTQDMLAHLEGVKRLVGDLMPRLNEPSPVICNGTAESPTMNGVLHHPKPAATTATSDLIADIKTKLAEWLASAGASQDCPLPELYRSLETAERISIGQFHDALRQLDADRIIHLHPWTGPLYALPEPAFALLIGHEIAYYANVR